MSEQMNTNMEKIYFSYILNNPDQFVKVETEYFQNQDIQFVYKTIRDEYILSPQKLIPSPKQIASMVRLNDPEQRITNDVLKILLKDNTEDIEESWLLPRFKAWKLSHTAKNRVMTSIDLLRGIQEVNYDNVKDVTGQIKALFDNMSLVDDDNNDLGEDFDDPESHKQNVAVNKIPSGWATMDSIMNGGWDHGSLTVIMGETNVGKSMWMHNMASNMANNGSNVVIITLEMQSYKVMKRLGSMRLKINPADYDEVSKDSQYMKTKINELKRSSGSSDLFESKPGKIFVKKFNTSDCTVTDIDNYLRKLEDTKKMKIDSVIIDYINIMSIEKGLDYSGSMLYLKGKHLAEGLRYLADKHNVAIITATQINKDVWGASDIKINDIPESKAIAEASDTVWGIIRNSEMKKNNKYRLKILKLRDGEHHEEMISFDFNPNNLCIENDSFVGSK